MAGVEFFREVTVPTAGVECRDTDALECLLALCRTMGLRYKVSPSAMEGKFDAYVGWEDWPTDFFVPCKRSGCVSEIGHVSPVSALSSAITGAVRELVHNGNSFSASFKQDWLAVQGYEWAEHWKPLLKEGEGDHG